MNIQRIKQAIFPFNVALAAHDVYGNGFGHSSLIGKIVHKFYDELNEEFGHWVYGPVRNGKSRECKYHRSFSYYEADGRILSPTVIEVNFYSMQDSFHGGRGQLEGTKKFTVPKEWMAKTIHDYAASAILATIKAERKRRLERRLKALATKIHKQVMDGINHDYNTAEFDSTSSVEEPA